MDGSIFDNFDKLDEHLRKEALQKASAMKLSFGEALRELARETPELFRLREALWRKREDEEKGVKHYTVIDGQLKELDAQIDGLVREAMNKHPDLGYAQGLNVVASERPELFLTRQQYFRYLSR